MKSEKVFRMFLLTGVVLVIAFTSPVCAYKLPDTGITKCYDDVGAEIPCPQPGTRFYGQDANYQGPQLAYRDNGNGTVTDLNTGLVWQQGDEQNDCKIGSDDCYTWQEAVDYCNVLSLPGCSAWRLPTLPELKTLVDYGRYGPAINTEFFPGCRSGWYWSGSTDDPGSPGLAWYVSFSDGLDGWHTTKGNSKYVRCVCTGS